MSGLVPDHKTEIYPLSPLKYQITNDTQVVDLDIDNNKPITLRYSSIIIE